MPSAWQSVLSPPCWITKSTRKWLFGPRAFELLADPRSRDLLWRRLSEWDWWGPRLTEEESAGSAGRQFTPIVILYSATHCVLLSADTSCHTPSLHHAAAGLLPSHHRRPLHAVQHRYALIYEPPRPLKTSGHFPAKRKIAPPSGQ